MTIQSNPHPDAGNLLSDTRASGLPLGRVSKPKRAVLTRENKYESLQRNETRFPNDSDYSFY